MPLDQKADLEKVLKIVQMKYLFKMVMHKIMHEKIILIKCWVNIVRTEKSDLEILPAAQAPLWEIWQLKSQHIKAIQQTKGMVVMVGFGYFKNFFKFLMIF